MSTNKWIIQDWTGKHCYTDQVFDSFEATRDYITVIADERAIDRYPNDEKAREELSTGICEDLYAVLVNERGEVIDL